MKNNYYKSRSLKLFFKSKYHSIKHYKYFKVYDHLFSKFINKKITFVEVGILNGGSLEIWRNFFGNKARIIGVDLNPECKKFEKNGIEIYIGDQSDKKFWHDFFKKIGKVDIVLDDGGHTNKQQITTAISAIPQINDNGMFVCEDTHTSYLEEFNNPNKYSFVEFTKKCIDDINFTFPNLNKFIFSLNKYIYSIQTFESIVCFHISKKDSFTNSTVYNNKIKSNITDYRYGPAILKTQKDTFIFNKIPLLKKIIFIFFNYLSLKKKKNLNRELDKENRIYFD
jgi:23S rRNA U2552 (ribose-2'-O)-methylase RlmE/FtsJ